MRVKRQLFDRQVMTLGYGWHPPDAGWCNSWVGITASKNLSTNICYAPTYLFSICFFSIFLFFSSIIFIFFPHGLWERDGRDYFFKTFLFLKKAIIFLNSCCSKDWVLFSQYGMARHINRKLTQSLYHHCVKSVQIWSYLLLLCLNEKLAIALHKDDNMLNKRPEIISKCRHRNNTC